MILFKKILKILGIIIFVLFVAFYVVIYIFLTPSSDKKVIKKLQNHYSTPTIYYNTFNQYKYRVIAMQKEIDTTLPTLVFVHGSPGNTLDYKRYFTDSILNKNANIIGYDRVGYGLNNLGDVQGSLTFEEAVLNDAIKDINLQQIILIGYSYGGTIVMASPKDYKYKISLAGAVAPDLEPMFWTLKFYDWKLTRWLLPKTLQAAAKEKYSHLTDLPKFADKWNVSPSRVLDIQGDKDWIVPYENSMYLKNKISQNKFTLVTIKGVGHELIWSDFELIRNKILTILKQ